MRKRLTERDIERALPGSGDRWLIDAERSRGVGRLALRLTAGGAKRFYYRYSARGGRRVDLAIGPWGANGESGTLTLEQARAKTAEWRVLLNGAAQGDLKAYLDRQQRTDIAVALDASLQARVPTDTAGEPPDVSFKALLDAYVNTLRVDGKDSARDVANIFLNHVYNPWPELAVAPAANITTPHVVAMLRRVVLELKHGRTGGKLRSYLRAAFAAAMASATDAAAPAALTEFGVITNPVASTKALTQFIVPRGRNLDSLELGFFWVRLRDRDDSFAQVLMIALLLGGQRFAQLLRLTCAKVNLVDRTLELDERKGPHKVARSHCLPISPRVHALIAPLVERSRAAIYPWVFSTTLRKKTCTESVSEIVNEICRAMTVAGETGEKFELRDLRRTAETQLAGLNVVKGDRAQLQSHGLTGVQDIHYDKWAYIPQKTAALTLWERKLDEWAAAAIASREPRIAVAGGNVIRFGPRVPRKSS